jgi:LacI family transcriptional regulator
MIKLLELELKNRNYTIIIMNTMENIEMEKECVCAAISKNVDGIIICPTQQSNEAIEIMKKNQIPFVLFGRYFKEHRYESVLVDDFQCGYLATNYLTGLGHEKILFINGFPHISSATERREGYKKALQEADIPFKPELIYEIDVNMHDCENLIVKALNEIAKFTAIITFNDVIAWETIYYLQECGYIIPENFSIVSIDNVQSHIHYPFPLTSVDMPKNELAEITVKSLFRLINDGFENTSVNILTPNLVIRGSANPLILK